MEIKKQYIYKNGNKLYGSNGRIYGFTETKTIINPWPPIGQYVLCARVYSNTTTDHITMNTVSWRYDSGSSTTYSDANCTNELSLLSQWNDYTANTVLPVIGEDEDGKFIEIYTNDDVFGYESPTRLCIILANDRVETVTDDSWVITKVKTYKNGETSYYYCDNNNPYKGQWFRGGTFTEVNL